MPLTNFNMKSLFTILLLSTSLALHARINVVATTPDLGSIAQAIGGENISLTVLCKPSEDPHFVDAKPSFVVRLNKADVLLEGGADLESGYLPALVNGARNAKIIPGAPGHCDCSAGIELLEKPQSLDRSQGDFHAKGNPHYAVDPLNAKIIAENVTRTFCKADAKNCAYYQTRLKSFSASLDKKLSEWTTILDPYRDSTIVAYHNSWPYFARRFNLKIDTFLEPKPGIPPTPAHLAAVNAKIKQQNIRAVYVEPFMNRKTAEAVSRNTGIRLVDVTHFPGGVKGAEGGYIELIDYLVNATAKALAK